ncbi:MAG: histidine phosphatase family protein [Xanthomonadales bacterium]|nr:histidine phosphatase family protein [Xanthomonadales bacterium]
MRLTLLRHAHAESPVLGESDHERSLSARGIEEARAAGQWLAARHRAPGAVLVSSARRAQETWQHASWSGCPEARTESGIYEATPGRLLDILEAQGNVDVLLVGHNPGFEELVALLTSGLSGEYRGMPPGGVAVLSRPADGDWEPAGATLLEFWSP